VKERIKRLHTSIREWLTQVLFKRYLTPLALVVVYVFVLGPTSVVARVLFRKHLAKTSGRADTNWITVAGYEGTRDDSLKQS
jgi:hypothetical protein